MSKRILTKEQIEALLRNQHILRCGEKSISYHKDFKILAVRKYQEGLSPYEIFRQARFDTNMIGRDAPHECLHRWLKIFRKKGESGLRVDGRGQSKAGGRPKSIESLIAGLPEKEKVKRLEAEVAYLKEENSFLAKLRKKS